MSFNTNQYYQQNDFQESGFQQQPQILQQQPSQPTQINPITGSSTSWVQPSNIEPLVVLLCNFFLPGLGHIVMGQHKKGIAILIIWMISYVIFTILASLLVGIVLVPFLVIHMGIILYDGIVLAERMKNGFPIMQGECATSWIKPGLSCIVTPDTVFNHNNLEECPSEWISTMKQINQNNQNQNQ
jgi:hypothetical protein